MTQQLQFSRRVPRGWFALMQSAVQAPRNRRPDFAQTEPVVFRSECFAEDLPQTAASAPTGLPRRAGWLAVAPLGLALLGAATADLVAALVAATLFGAFYAAVIAAHGVWSAEVFDEHPAAGLAAVSTALTIGTLIGPTVAGILIEHSGHAEALLAAAVAGFAALTFCPPSTRRRAALAEHQCSAAPVRP